MEAMVTAFVEALLAMDRLKIEEMVASAGAKDPLVPIDYLVVPALEYVGEQWEQGELSLSQVYMSGRLCEELITKLPPLTPLPLGDDEDSHSPAARSLRAHNINIGISTLDDYHLLGKRMVCAVLRASGYQLCDYGTTDPTTLAAHVVRDQIQVLLLSVLMLPAALRIKELRTALNAAGQCPRILVGGAPFRFDPNLCQEVGADAAGASAADALELVRAAEEALTP
ncbi:cobalamin B12-binding domain-containing protein [Rhabdochromatium marinum]|uniref:cobalamin B12-binding domain-containing protein n=1 Tax=Rhabdochromatium marinum TaxID=48729 RepID=UPI0019041AFB|nr:cobalamin-dependent protein [Rhabdochromatium marinum]MBK1648665.1 cobalamin-binding protein [Rhabdochromatium marinum]